MVDAGIDWHEFDDGPDPEVVDREDLGDFVIKWVDDRGFEPVTIKAELVRRGKDIEIPMELDGDPVLDPTGVVALEFDEAQSNEKLAVFKAKLTDEVLRDPKFYDRVAKPVKVTIRVKPLAEMAQTMAAISAGPATIERSCHVGVEIPKSRIRWENPEQGNVRDQRFDVAADAQDTMEMHVWYERWDPVEKKISTVRDVEFSHMTNEKFDPEVFGPHPTSQPWESGTSDPRWCSLWQSKMVLPADGRRETLPWDGFIRVKAWRQGDIVARPRPNKITLRPGAAPLAVAFVPVRLGLGKSVAKLVSPDEPICADDQLHEMVLQFADERSGKPLDSGVVSWELVTSANAPGGSIDPSQGVLTPADEGKVKFNYRPPKLTYTPGASYQQDLRCYVGAGDDRRDAGVVQLFVSPEIKAELAAKKCGLDFDPPYSLTIPCFEAPDRIVGHVGFESLEPDANRERFDVFDATPKVTILADSGSCELTLETRTDAQGRYTLLLPELSAGLAKLAETSARRQRILEPFRDEFPGDFERGADPASLYLVERYRGHVVSSLATLSRVLPADLMRSLNDEPLVLGRHLSIKPETDCRKCKEGLRIVDAVVSTTAKVDELQEYLLKQGLQCFYDFVAALWDFLNTFLKLAERFLGFIAKAGNVLAPWVLPLIRTPLNAILNIASRFFPETAISLQIAMQKIASGTVPAGEALQAIVDPALKAMRQALITGVTTTAGTAKTLLQRINSAGVIGGIPGKAAEQARDKVIDAITGALVDMIREPGSAAIQRASLETLRDMLGLDDFDRIAHGVIGGTVRNVDGFAYVGEPGTAALYLTRLPQIIDNVRQLDARQYDWKRNWEAVVAAVDLLMNVALLCAVISAALIPFTGGTSGLVAMGTLGMRILGMELIGKAKALLGMANVLARAYLLTGGYAELVKVYQVYSLQLTGSM